MIICKNSIKNNFKNFTIKADKYVIKPSNTIKILGTYISNNLKLDTEIGKLCSQLHNRINNLNKVKQYTNFQSRLQFMNAFVIGKLRYMLLIYMGADTQNITKLHRVLMKAARRQLATIVVNSL